MIVYLDCSEGRGGRDGEEGGDEGKGKRKEYRWKTKMEGAGA